MRRLFALASVLALAVVLAAPAVQADDKDKKKDDKPTSIGEFMKKAHAGDGALKAAVTNALKEKDFKEAAAPMKAWAAIASHLGTFDPPKGDKEDWKKQTKKYAENVKALAKTIEDKNEKKATAALETINKSCGACHSLHKPKKK